MYTSRLARRSASPAEMPEDLAHPPCNPPFGVRQNHFRSVIVHAGLPSLALWDARKSAFSGSSPLRDFIQGKLASRVHDVFRIKMALQGPKDRHLFRA